MVDDQLADLSQLDEETLLVALQRRYAANHIYTYVGDILVAVNPFCLLSELYSRQTSHLYRRPPGKLPPHVFAIAEQTYSSMLTSGNSQVCVVSGESGAGKTESSKFFIQQVMEMCRTASGHGGLSLEDKILLVNPLLEAFGNAQTVLNDNSSRFGKFIELFFDSTSGQVTGAGIQHYLLEKSRVAKQGEDERNFHIFYYMYAGLPPSELRMLHLKDPTAHQYMNRNVLCKDLCSSKESVVMFGKVCNSLDAVDFTIDERSQLVQLLAAVLLTGDLDISGDDSASIANPETLNFAGELLGVDPVALGRALTTSVNQMRGEVITIAYGQEKAMDCRDAMAKALYGRAFNWIVNKINILLGGPDGQHQQKTVSIAVLDIFGFEDFRFNSLEQFCINLANEQLQHFFNNCVFAMEQVEYVKEGVSGSDIKFEDNMPVLRLFFDKPIGLLSLLNEQSLFPRGTDQSAMQKFQQHLSSNRYYQPSRGLDAGFIVKHYAGSVEYQSKGFLDKNRDTLATDVVSTLSDSQCPLVAYLFCSNPPPLSSVLLSRSSRIGSSRGLSYRLRGAFTRFSRQVSRQQRASVNRHRNTSQRSRRGRKNKTTVCGHFRESLDLLMAKLNSSKPHFIRCIKPNDQKQPLTFDNKLVLKQLRYTGMVEVVRIRKEGYAYRPKFAEFLYSYRCLGHAFTSRIKPTADACSRVLTFCGLSGWKIGHTRVMLKFWHKEKLNSCIHELDKHACVLQKIARGFLTRRKMNFLWQLRSHEMVVLETFLKSIELKCNALCLLQRSLIDEDISHWKATRIEPVALAPPPLPPKPSLNNFSSQPAVPARFGRRFWHSRNKRASAEALARNLKVAVAERQKSLKNWRKEEGSRGAGLMEVSSNIAFAPWFHGMISRKQAEATVEERPSGTFLVRTSESRFGYSLTVYWEPRVRHYLVEQIPGGKYRVVGISISFDELSQLVDYYSHHPLSTEGDKLLTPYGEAAVVSKKEAKKRGLAEVRNYRKSGWGRNRGVKSNKKAHRKGRSK